MSHQAKQRLVRLLLILGMIAGLCLFLAGALRENIVFFKTPSELIKLNASGQKLRLGGQVVKGSVKSVNDIHTFEVADELCSIKVRFKGRFPDLFREGQGVVAIGTYDVPQKLFKAQQLLAKHDQYYRPPQTLK